MSKKSVANMSVKSSDPTNRAPLMSSAKIPSSDRTSQAKLKRTHFDTSGNLDQNLEPTGLSVNGDPQGGGIGGSQYMYYGSAGRRKDVQYENTYRMEPEVKFGPRTIETITQNLLAQTLARVTYEPHTCRRLSQELAGKIMEKIKSLNIHRYKYVAVVSIGSLRERPGMHFGSRCLWDQETDSFATVKYTNSSLFAVAMLYGLYYE